ncbi:MAG: V-type ATP synthase subunit D [Candidatus Anstonellales archaeon]
MEERINPTRMELLKARQRTKLATKGHSLLKQKRDALVLEFFNLLKKAADLREILNSHMKMAYAALAIAESCHGEVEVEAAAMTVSRAPKIQIEVKNVMGVLIPSVTVEALPPQEIDFEGRFLTSSAKIDEASEAFKKALDMIVKLAETESAMRRLIKEIEHTKRRVNSLEYIIIPRLKLQARTIAFYLEEMERNSFFMLKMIKKKLE